VQVDAIPDRTLRGEVRLLMPGANRQKATVAAKIALLDKDPRLKPDMSCKVIFLKEAAASRGAPKLLVPDSAVVREGGESVVYLFQNGTARRRPVVTGDAAAGRVEIRSGLKEGDQVLTTFPRGVRDGDAVRTKAP
jgi:membrane fusion protein (multidrug efflux system)